MVIQPMRFIDNGRTVPQVLKASPPLSTLSSSPRSRGMHPIIGTLSVSPRGDNDALPPNRPPSLSPLFCIPTTAFLFLLSDLNRSQKISFIHCVPRYPVKRELGGRERRKDRKRKRSVEQSEETTTKQREKEQKEKGRIYSCFQFLARAGYALRRSCKTCLLRRIPIFSPPSSFPLFLSSRSFASSNRRSR